MTAIVVLLAFLAICVLAARDGVDSRHDHPGRQL
jgi:hypothetical protein